MSKFKNIHETDDGRPVQHHNGDGWVHVRHYEELLAKHEELLAKYEELSEEVKAID